MPACLHSKRPDILTLLNGNARCIQVLHMEFHFLIEIAISTRQDNQLLTRVTAAPDGGGAVAAVAAEVKHLDETASAAAPLWMNHRQH
jgi:hypothetical protein